MKPSFKELDIAMNNLYEKLTKKKKTHPNYQQNLAKLNQLYQEYKNNNYKNAYFYYTYIDDVETLLTNEGYLEQSSKEKSR